MIGQTVSHYRILEKLGEGGMGIVYKAEDTRLKRPVALKFLPAELTRDSDAKARFIHEARAAAALSHPHIVTVHEIGEHEGQVFIVMEYVEGRSLRELIAADRPLPVALALDIACQTARGLAAAHAKGIVHRDVKPANIIITNEKVAKLLDFGIAKLAGADTKLTKTGTTMGTTAYMSPEQASGKDVDARTDIWSLGVILYEMLAGEPPFKGDYAQSVIYAILNEELKPLSAFRSGLPAGLQCIIERVLAKKPEDRYQSMGELAASLHTANEGTLPLSSGMRSLRVTRARAWQAALAIVSAALVLVFGLDVGRLRSRLLGSGDNAPRIVRLAVLPLDNLSNDPQQEYFSDGLTQELISRLGQLHPQSLSVIARTSVMRYKKSDAPIDQIGRELNVDYVLEGSALREGTRVKVTVELIQARSQAQVWSSSYERELSGILALQNELAGRVADVLAIKLLPGEKMQLAKVHTVDPEAYDLYLKGCRQKDTLTQAGLDVAQRYFELALEKEPEFAPAYAGIAEVWGVRQQIAITPVAEAAPKLRAAALKAMALDNTLAAVHYTVAGVLAWSDWDWGGAEREYRKAIELDSSISRKGFSHVLMILRRPDEAMVQIERTLELDPFDAITLSFYAVNLLCTHRYEESIAQARQVLRLQPGQPVALTALIRALHESGRQDEVIKVAAGYYADWPLPDVKEALVHGYAEAGYAGAWRRAADAQGAKHAEEPGIAVDMADNYLFAGDRSRALDWLEKSIVQHDPNAPYVNCWPLWEPLRSNARFQALLKRMNLAND